MRLAGMRLPGNGCAGQRIDRDRRASSRQSDGPLKSPAARPASARTRARRAAILDVPLDVAEEVQLVPDDRAADRPAEVVALQLVLRLVVLLEEVVLRVQRVVAPEVEAAAAELFVPPRVTMLICAPPAPPNSGP